VRDGAVYTLLALGVGAELLAAAGVLAMRGAYDKLHYVAPSTLGAVLIAAAVWVRDGPSFIGLKAILLAAFLVVASPTLAHATARAARISERGDWRPQREDGIEVEER
jgi:monovalent cation/proton antiporter MnhG/PhaG subunit